MGVCLYIRRLCRAISRKYLICVLAMEYVTPYRLRTDDAGKYHHMLIIITTNIWHAATSATELTSRFGVLFENPQKSSWFC